MKRVWSVVVGVVVAVPLFGGPAGDYVGLTTMANWIYDGIKKDSVFGYPSWQVTVDTIVYDSVAISSYFTLNGNDAYERYNYIKYADGSVDGSMDTLYENANEVWAVTNIEGTVDTAYKIYITPLNVGDSWDEEAGGTYSLGDLDGDGVEDTLTVSHDTATVLSYGSFSVPAGTFDAFKIFRKGRVYVHLTTGTEMVQRIFEYERFVPQLGMIYDSVVSVDTTSGVETGWHYNTLRLLRAEDIKERASFTTRFDSKKIIITHSSQLNLNDVKDATLYSIDGSCVSKGIKGSVLLPHKGVFILKGKVERGSITYRIIYR